VPMIIYLLPRLLASMAFKVASGRSDQPGNSAGRVIVSCLVLHRTRVARPQHRCCAGALLPHRFTLTNRSWRFIFCCPVSHAFRRGSSLTTVLPYGVRTFLTPRQPEERDHPANASGFILTACGVSMSGSGFYARSAGPMKRFKQAIFFSAIYTPF
jgi:hypothetical protein